MGGPMVYRINQLPSDIICYIFGFLNVGDACRARLSSSEWLHLPDSRTVLHFDSLNVLGKEIERKDSLALQSKFVNTINRFLEVWKGERMHKLVVRFVLGNEHASHIDRWIATCAMMEVEEIELDFSGICQERYVFPSHVVCYEKAPYLKRLCLRSCTLSIPCERTSWLSNLATINLSQVDLDQGKIDFILSASPNLVSLGLFDCNLPRREFVSIAGSLKKLSIRDTLSVIILQCPNLEVFEYHGSIRSIMFSHVPVLREAKLWPRRLRPRSFLLLLCRLATCTPTLEVLSLSIMNEVKALPRRFPSLKQLNISLPVGFDLLSITHLVNASRFLETLQIEINSFTVIPSIKKGKAIFPWHPRPHSHLKQVKIGGFNGEFNETELALYLLESSMAIEQMVIQMNGDAGYTGVSRTRLLKRQTINPTAKVIILGPLLPNEGSSIVFI